MIKFPSGLRVCSSDNNCLVAISESTKANSDKWINFAVFPLPLSVLPSVLHDIIEPLANCNSALLFLIKGSFIGSGILLYIAFNLLNIALVLSSLWLNNIHTHSGSVIA